MQQRWTMHLHWPKPLCSTYGVCSVKKCERMIKKITTTATKDAFLCCYPVLNAIHDTFKHTHKPGDMPRHTALEMIYLTKPECKEQYGKTKWTKWNNALSSGNCEMNEFFYTWAKWIGLCRTYAGCLLLVLVCILFSYYYLLVCRRRHLFACFNFSSFLFIGSSILGSISFWYVAVFFSSILLFLRYILRLFRWNVTIFCGISSFLLP